MPTVSMDDSDEYWSDGDPHFWDEAIKVSESVENTPSKLIKPALNPPMKASVVSPRFSIRNIPSQSGLALTRDLASPSSSPSKEAKLTTPKAPTGFSSKIKGVFSPTSNAHASVTPPKPPPLRDIGDPPDSIIRAFNELRIKEKQRASPSVSPKRPFRGKKLKKVVYIESDDSDEERNDSTMVPTDTESSSPPTREASLFDIPSPATSVSSVWSTGSFEHPRNITHSPQPTHDHIINSQATSPSITFNVSNKPQIIPPQADYTLPAALPSSPAYFDEFLDGQIGTKLEPSYIAHNRDVQKIMDREHISWGVQYELARGVSVGSWNWSQVLDKLTSKDQLKLFKGPNAATAYKVKSVMLDRPLKDTSRDLSIWQELDREQKAIMENCSRGLGLMGYWEDDPDWHGGRIQQLAHLVKDGDSYKVQLDPLEMRRCHRVARYLSSRRVIQLGVPDALVNEENAQVKAFLSKKFILCGRVFVPFHSKDNGVYMIETNEDWERGSETWCGDQYRKSFAEFLSWHNPLGLNNKQPISKWSTRFAIILSNSTPVLEFEASDIIFIDDIYASDWSGPGKAPAEKIMTDGCGFMNRNGLLRICRKLVLPSLPTAVQGRIAGAKGLWILCPWEDDSDRPRIWIRNSQNKIKLPYLDKAHRIFDLLTVSRPSTSVNLSKQSIINLAHNGIPHSDLKSLLVQGLTDGVKPLMDWKRPQHLWDVVNKKGGVSSARVQRQATDPGRVTVLQRREWGHTDAGERDTVNQEDVEESRTATYTGRNEYSGAPLSLHEYTVELLQAGFHPADSKILRGKIRYIVDQAITSAVERYMIPLAKSFGAFIVPDPLGVLEEGQVYYRASEPMKDNETETLFDVVTGEIVLGRYPIRLPSDMQKVTAVDVPALRNWPDVLIVSTKGSYSLASLLAGGDYDGDEPFAICEPSLVKLFQNKELTRAPPNLMDYFESDVETVTDFDERIKHLRTEDAQKAFQDILLLSLSDAKVGLYSNFHDFAISEYGYDHEFTIRLAYIFGTLLDSSKTGLRLKPDVFKVDQAKFGRGMREKAFKPGFILDSLLKAGNEQRDTLLGEYDEGDYSDLADPELKAPYDAVAKQANDAFAADKFMGFANDLKRIRDHVDAAHNEFRISCSKAKLQKESTPKKKKGKNRSKGDDFMLRAARKFSEPLDGIVYIREVETVKASYAYHCSAMFAFNVAFRELCLIKAIASQNGIAPTTREFDEARAITASWLRAMARNDEDRD